MMPEFFQFIGWQGLLNILLIAIILFWLFLVLRGTLALKMVVGLGMILGSVAIGHWIGLYTLDWLTTTLWSQIALAIIILFHPEIRRGLVRIGQLPFIRSISEVEESRTIDEIVKASVSLAKKQIGAIMVLERDIDLGDVVEMGIPMDAMVSKELLNSIFLPTSPLHDGAVIIRNGRIVAAGCFLPLTLRGDTSPVIGTRHRAALGVTEETDAVVIVVSEEAGTISLIEGGKMTREVNVAGLRQVLNRTALSGEGREAGTIRRWFRGLSPSRFKANPDRSGLRRRESR